MISIFENVWCRMELGENVKGRRVRVVWSWGRVRWAWNKLKKKKEFCIEWSAGQHCGRAGRQRKLDRSSGRANAD